MQQFDQDSVDWKTFFFQLGFKKNKKKKIWRKNGAGEGNYANNNTERIETSKLTYSGQHYISL